MKENNPGNYVSVGVTGLPTSFVSTLPGIITPDPHITLMYSKNSAVPKHHIESILRRRNLNGLSVKVSGASVFDSQKDESDVKLGCIVLNVDSQEIRELYNHLCRIGCKHSYSDFKPHATLIYDCPIEQCELTVKELEHKIATDGIFLKCTTFTNDFIQENWASVNS